MKRTYIARSLAISINLDDEVAAVEFISQEGEHIAVEMTGKGLIGIRDKINETLSDLPEIETWDSGAARH